MAAVRSQLSTCFSSWDRARLLPAGPYTAGGLQVALGKGRALPRSGVAEHDP